MDDISLLNAKRAIIARAIQAENDYDAISREYWSQFRPLRYFSQAPFPKHLDQVKTRAWYEREWARTNLMAIWEG